MSKLLTLIRSGAAVFLSTNPKVFTWKETKMWFLGSHEYGGQGRWRVSNTARVPRMRSQLGKCSQWLGPKWAYSQLSFSKTQVSKTLWISGSGAESPDFLWFTPKCCWLAQVLHSWPFPAVQSGFLQLSFEPNESLLRGLLCASAPTEPLLRPPWQLVSILTVPDWAKLSTFLACLVLFSFLLHMITLGN